MQTFEEKKYKKCSFSVFLLIAYLYSMKVLGTISQQYNNSPRQYKYYVPVDGPIYFQIPCEVVGVDVIDLATDTAAPAVYDAATGIVNDQALTNVVTCPVPLPAFYFAFLCADGSYFYSEQLRCKKPCEELLKVEALRGCSYDFEGIWHGPIFGAETNPELTYRHCIWLEGSISLPTFRNTYTYTGAGDCSTHLSTSQEAVVTLRASNFTPYLATQLNNTLGATNLTINGTPYAPQDVEIKPLPKTCLYKIEQRLSERSMLFHAACLAQCTTPDEPCGLFALAMEGSGITIEVEHSALDEMNITFQSFSLPPMYATAQAEFVVVAPVPLPRGNFALGDMPLQALTGQTIIADNIIYLELYYEGCRVCYVFEFPRSEVLILPIGDSTTFSPTLVDCVSCCDALQDLIDAGTLALDFAFDFGSPESFNTSEISFTLQGLENLACPIGPIDGRVWACESFTFPNQSAPLSYNLDYPNPLTAKEILFEFSGPSFTQQLGAVQAVNAIYPQDSPLDLVWNRACDSNTIPDPFTDVYFIVEFKLATCEKWLYFPVYVANGLAGASCPSIVNPSQISAYFPFAPFLSDTQQNGC